MKNMMSKARRIMALALVLAMTLTTLGGYAPGWFRTFAEPDTQEQAVPTEPAPAETAASEQEGNSTGGDPVTPAEGETDGTTPAEGEIGRAHV